MSEKHHINAMTAIVLLVLFLVIFWNKLSALFTQQTSVTASVAGIPQTVQSQTLNASNAGNFGFAPDNAPVVVPYTPTQAPSVTFNDTYSTLAPIPTAAMFHPTVFSDARRYTA